MDPDRLSRWEPILQSDVAVALLLLAALVVACGYLVFENRSLRRENQQLNTEYREYLKASADVALLVRNARRLLTLGDRGGK